jgi:hypothetical protein
VGLIGTGCAVMRCKMVVFFSCCCSDTVSCISHNFKRITVHLGTNWLRYRSSGFIHHVILVVLTSVLEDPTVTL